MSKLIERLKSGNLQVELAAGISILALACANTFLLNRSLSYLELSIDAILIVFYEALARNKKAARYWFAKPILWTIAIILATAAIIIIHLL